MADGSKIEWTDATFNPWVGCTKVSPACDHCYAESWAKRAGNPELWHGERRRTAASNWRQPVKWNRQATGERKRVFCASLADVFDNEVPAEWRRDLFDLIGETPHLTWQLLTKRIGNVEKMLPGDWGDGWPNVWIGSTVVNQEEADRDAPKLLATPAAVRFVSAEPLLGPIDFTNINNLLDWIIAGGESGPGARPMHPDWVRSIRDQCAAAGVPFFFKQWGEWAPAARQDGHPILNARGYALPSKTFGMPTPTRVVRVGKKAAGATLDGREHKAFPA